MELQSVNEFEVYTDYENLEYFMTTRKLTEHQMRWSLVLSWYNFQIVHIPGTANGRADALLRRDQDMPKNTQDDHPAFRLTPELDRGDGRAGQATQHGERECPGDGPGVQAAEDPQPVEEAPLH